MVQKTLSELIEELDTYCTHLEVATYVALVALLLLLDATLEVDARQSRGASKCPTCGCARDPAQDVERTRE